MIAGPRAGRLRRASWCPGASPPSHLEGEVRILEQRFSKWVRGGLPPPPRTLWSALGAAARESAWQQAMPAA